MADQNVLSQDNEQTPQPIVNPINPLSIPAGIIRPRHLQAGYLMVQVGLAANRPATSSVARFYFASDTFVLSYYDTVTNTWKSGSAFS